jgi:hypothetical protein
MMAAGWMELPIGPRPISPKWSADGALGESASRALTAISE